LENDPATTTRAAVCVASVAFAAPVPHVVFTSVAVTVGVIVDVAGGVLPVVAMLRVLCVEALELETTQSDVNVAPAGRPLTAVILVSRDVASVVEVTE
jgi:hypothetical protein